MSHGRSFESGASKRRREREQQQKDDETVRKMTVIFDVTLGLDLNCDMSV